MNATVGNAGPFAGPFGEQLHRRLSDAAEQARDLLGLPPTGRAELGLEGLRALAGALSEQLPAGDGRSGLLHEHQAAVERMRARFEARFKALAQVQAAVAELREITSPREMLGRAPAVLCGASRLERAILSLVAGGRMVAQAAHFAGDEDGAARVLVQLRASPVRL
jgi:hypothetical protein